MAKRLRILAGPNGSGKTSIYMDLRDSFSWGIFVNADVIESSLRKNAELNFSEYGISKVDEGYFNGEYNKSELAQKSACKISNFIIIDGVLIVHDVELIDSYFSAFVASFIQYRLIELGFSFSLETVMSHPSKIDLMNFAKRNGYRLYLYYVSTQSPDINIQRVHSRVIEGGHNVNEGKIRKRYTNSLKQLLNAIRISDRAYLFDNSKPSYELVAEYDASNSVLSVKTHVNWIDNVLTGNNQVTAI